MHKGEKALLTSCASYTLPFPPRAKRVRRGKGGGTRAPGSLPLRRKVSCVIKQRVRNVSSVQRRPYCLHCEAPEAEGDDGGVCYCCPARIEARRVATGEDGRVKRSRKRREKKEVEEKDKKGAVSGTRRVDREARGARR